LPAAAYRLVVLYRVVALLLVSYALMLGVRDAVGVHDADAVSSLLPVFHDRLWGVVRIAMLSVAAIVAWCGVTNRSTRLLAMGLIGIALNNNWWFLGLHNPVLFPAVMVNYLGIPFGLAALLRFTTSFDDPLARRLDRTARWFAPLLGVAMAAVGTLWWTSVLVANDPHPAYNVAFWLCWDAFNACLVGVSLALCVRRGTAGRAKFGLIFLSLAIAAAGTAIHGLLRVIVGESAFANDVDTIAQIALPLGLGYSVLRQNVFGLTFYVNRALLCTFLSSLITYIFAIAEEASKAIVEGLHIAPQFRAISTPGFELAASALVVVAFHPIEKRTDKLVERLRGEPRKA
jgi:hypothetical protein